MRVVLTALGAALLLVVGLSAELIAQAAKGNNPVALRGAPSQQNTLKVDNSTTPNRVNIGCETDQENTATVNGARVVGAATGSNPTLSAVACTGGDAAIGLTLTPLGTGTVILGGLHTTNVQFYPAVEFCRSDIPSAQLLPTRLAANDWALARTAAGAETYNIHCALPLPWRTTSSKGARLDSFSIAQQITVAALTSNTFNALATTTYANNVANAVAAHGGSITITMPTATQANPYLTAGTVGTPAFMQTAATQVSVDFTVVMQNTGVYRLYGIAVTWTSALY